MLESISNFCQTSIAASHLHIKGKKKNKVLKKSLTSAIKKSKQKSSKNKKAIPKSVFADQSEVNSRTFDSKINQSQVTFMNYEEQKEEEDLPYDVDEKEEKRVRLEDIDIVDKFNEGKRAAVNSQLLNVV